MSRLWSYGVTPFRFTAVGALGFSQLTAVLHFMSGIGDRVLGTIERVRPAPKHREIAASIGMTPDAFSRALSGKRQFASVELARLADLLGEDLHWLITGTADPNQLSVTARHDYDHETGDRNIPGREGDSQTLDDIALAYRQAFPEPVSPDDLPSTPAAIEDRLGQEFVRPFADRLEQMLRIDVVRVAQLSTAYSFTVGGRRVIAVPATGNWFRENWDMAHELGHLVLGHHDDGLAPIVSDEHEAAANAYAAALLLPEGNLKQIDWESVSESELAGLVWSLGVSTDALARRLNTVLGSLPDLLASWSAVPTQRLLRRGLAMDSEIDEITKRMDDASQRRFPLAVQEAHLERIASGEIGKATLAWMLGIDTDALDVDAPSVPEVDTDELSESLGL